MSRSWRRAPNGMRMKFRVSSPIRCTAGRDSDRNGCCCASRARIPTSTSRLSILNSRHGVGRSPTRFSTRRLRSSRRFIGRCCRNSDGPCALLTTSLEHLSSRSRTLNLPTEILRGSNPQSNSPPIARVGPSVQPILSLQPARQCRATAGRARFDKGRTVRSCEIECSVATT